MTNQTDPNQQAQPNEAKKTESIGSKVSGGLSWWIGSLMGKPTAGKAPSIPQQAPNRVAQTQPSQAVPAPVTTEKPQNPAPGGEDSISQDVQALRKLVGGFSSKITSKVTPVVKEGISGTSRAADSFGKKVGPKFMTKILRIFFVIIFVVIIAFVASKLFSGQGGNGGGLGNSTPTQFQSEATPTSVFYNPPKASIYASDESILKLEEDINVISREVESTVLKETQLVPPTLDFNVNFK